MASGTEKSDTAQKVDCVRSQNLESHAGKTLSDGDSPDITEISQESGIFCEGEFEAFAGASHRQPQLEILPLTPGQEAWDHGDRLISCMIMDAACPVMGALRNAGR